MAVLLLSLEALVPAMLDATDPLPSGLLRSTVDDELRHPHSNTTARQSQHLCLKL
jgi:hypothetical protein